MCLVSSRFSIDWGSDQYDLKLYAYLIIVCLLDNEKRLWYLYVGLVCYFLRSSLLFVKHALEQIADVISASIRIYYFGPMFFKFWLKTVAMMLLK